jgi:hypothetical protein
MTGTDCGFFTHKSVPVIFEPPCNLTKEMSALSMADSPWYTLYTRVRKHIRVRTCIHMYVHYVYYVHMPTYTYRMKEKCMTLV